MEGSWRESPTYSWKHMLVALGLIVLGIFGCLLATMAAADETCRRAAQVWIPRYPDAEVVEERYTFVRPFGLGETGQLSFSPDPINTVSRWYLDTRTRASIARETTGFATMDYFLSEAEGGGTQILLTSSCGIQ